MRHVSWEIALVCASLGACSAPATSGDTGAEQDIASATLELNRVPAGAQCLRVDATGLSPSPTFALTAGTATTTLSLGKLQLGSVTINASVFDVACASIGTNKASWIADPVTITTTVGDVPKVELQLRQYQPTQATTDFLPSILKTAAGDFGYILLLADGTVESVGDIFGVNPTAVPALTGVVDIFAGGRTFCGLKSDATLWCWGENGNKQLQNSSASFITTPIQEASAITTVAAGRAHLCFWGPSQGEKCQGANNAGQLGDGTTIDRATPVTPSGPAFIAEKLFAGGDRTCRVTGAGDVYCWGSNAFGELGDGTTTPALTPRFIASAFVSLVLSPQHTCALLPNATVKCWGSNGSGALGDGTTVNSPLPKLVPGLSAVTHLGNSFNHTCARVADGRVACWGAGNLGQLGDGTAAPHLSPTFIPNFTGTLDLVSGSGWNLTRMANHNLVWWGYPGLSGLGDASFPAYSPALVSTW